MQKFLKLFGVTTRASTIVAVNNRPEMLVMAVNVGSKRFTQHGQVTAQRLFYCSMMWRFSAIKNTLNTWPTKYKTNKPASAGFLLLKIR